MASEEHLAILKLGVEVWNRWRRRNPGVLPILSSTGNSKPDLSGLNLSGADLSFAYLVDANLAHASLPRANLSKALLLNANFNSVNLNNTDFTNAQFAFTNFSDTDLSTAKGLETVRHRAPSSRGVDTIYKSKGNIPDAFLRDAGVPENFITYMHDLTGQAFNFYSCFISHSTKDKRFCERIYADLQAKKVRTWYFPEDAIWGETVWGQIDQSIKIYDNLVVICSKNSLRSGPVLREIERALSREDREGKNVLSNSHRQLHF